MREELDRLLQEIRALHQALREDVRGKWKRSLPFEDELFDRWERAQFLGFGKGASIYQQSYVYGDVRVGEHTWVGPLTVLDGSGGLTIGDYCSISAGVHIYTHDTIKWALTGGAAKYEYAPVTIGNCCHIGALSVITKGITVGDHCVVGAHSFVNHDVPPYTVAVGVPARPIARVEQGSDGDVRFVHLKASERGGP